MASATISKPQMLHLLSKLSSDDGFRSRFEKDPRAGLIEAGVPASHAATFPAEKLGSGVLADKAVFAAEHQRVAKDLAEECMCMVVPSPHWKPHGH